MNKAISTILIVDDSRAIRSLMRRELTSVFCGSAQIFEAGDGVEALKVLEIKEIDLVFLDINMPGLDGIDTLLEMRRRGCASAVIMVTADSARTQVQRAVQAGAKGYVAKPFSRAGIAKAIERIFGGGAVMGAGSAPAAGVAPQTPVLDYSSGAGGDRAASPVSNDDDVVSI